MVERVGAFAEDKDIASSIRQLEIMPTLSRCESVVLDFTGVSLTTQSFIHALICDVLRTYKEAALEMLDFKGCLPGVRGIVETVVQYTFEAEED